MAPHSCPSDTLTPSPRRRGLRLPAAPKLCFGQAGVRSDQLGLSDNSRSQTLPNALPSSTNTAGNVLTGVTLTLAPSPIYGRGMSRPEGPPWGSDRERVMNDKPLIEVIRTV